MKFCPFCDECHSIDLVTTTHPHGFAAWVRCGHCSARGSTYIDWSIVLASEAAMDAWAQAYRPNRLISMIKARAYELKRLFRRG